MLLEPGDRVELMVVRAARVLPNDVYWGTQSYPGSSPQKGFVLESEGRPIPKGAVPSTLDDKVQIGPYWINGGDLVLIQATRRP